MEEQKLCGRDHEVRESLQGGIDLWWVKVWKKNFKETRRGLNQQKHKMTLKPAILVNRRWLQLSSSHWTSSSRLRAERRIFPTSTEVYWRDQDDAHNSRCIAGKIVSTIIRTSAWIELCRIHGQGSWSSLYWARKLPPGFLWSGWRLPLGDRGHIRLRDTPHTSFVLILLDASLPRFLIILQGIAGATDVSKFLRAFLMVSLHSVSSGSMKWIPRNFRAFPRWSFSSDHFCFSFSLACFPFDFQSSGHKWSGLDVNCFLVRLHPDHTYPSGAFF